VFSPTSGSTVGLVIHHLYPSSSYIALSNGQLHQIFYCCNFKLAKYFKADKYKQIIVDGMKFLVDVNPRLARTLKQIRQRTPAPNGEYACENYLQKAAGTFEK
jgi:hypothetical protein